MQFLDKAADVPVLASVRPLGQGREQIADIPVPGGRRHGLSPDLHLAAEPEQAVFRTLHQFQKSAPAATLPSVRVHGHSSSSELSAHQIPRAGDPRDTSSRTKLACGCVCLQDAGTSSAQTWPSTVTSQVEEYLECDMGRTLMHNSSFFVLVSGSLCLFYLVLPEEYSTWFILGDYFRIRRIQRFLV